VAQGCAGFLLWGATLLGSRGPSPAAGAGEQSDSGSRKVTSPRSPNRPARFVGVRPRYGHKYGAVLHFTQKRLTAIKIKRGSGSDPVPYTLYVVAAFILGVFFGTRYRAIVLIPFSCAILVLGVAGCAALQFNILPGALLTVLSLAVLQLGYLIGAVYSSRFHKWRREGQFKPRSQATGSTMGMAKFLRDPSRSHHP